MNQISNRKRKCRSEKTQNDLPTGNKGQVSRQKIRWSRKKVPNEQDKSIQKISAQYKSLNSVNQIFVGPCQCGQGYIINKQMEPAKIIEQLMQDKERMQIKYEKKIKNIKAYYMDKIK